MTHSSNHTDESFHHHHSHGPATQHPCGHHLLQVEDLCVSFRMYDTDAPYFSAEQHDVVAIDRMNLSVHAGEVVAVVGASGSGKSLLADAIMGLYEPNATVCGRIWFDGVEQTPDTLSGLRGHGISLIPQSVASLNPSMKVGRQVQGAARGRGAVRRADKRARMRRQQQLFERYGLAADVADMYPHELSGGMARRVLLCCALMDNPRLIVADEPTPGLDLALAVQALSDLRAFANEGGGVMLITHDIELALAVADRVAVFRNGTVVEETAVENFASPDLLETDYARALWHALPEHDFVAPRKDEQGVRSVHSGPFSGPFEQHNIHEDAPLSEQSRCSESSGLSESVDVQGEYQHVSRDDKTGDASC